MDSAHSTLETAGPAAWSDALAALLPEALACAGDEMPEHTAALREAEASFRERRWVVLVAGLCSVGKSSFVSALWGDSGLLPTAVRDCTQTNTYVRVPGAGEAGRQVLAAYLSRAAAAAFTVQGFSFYRLAELLSEVLGPFAPRLDELPPEARLRTGLAGVKKLCAQRPELLVLHDYVSGEMEQLEQFLAFFDSPDYRPGETLAASWDERRDLLMGRRRPDGRTLDVGKLWTLQRVELVSRGAGRWRGAPPVLVDTPWIPLFHEARRVDLILEQARRADILVILAQPQSFQFEDWVLELFRERPALAGRTLVVFNQVDTVDTLALFTREGFASSFEENARRLAGHGIAPANLFMACARLPFLVGWPQDGLVAERIAKLRKVLDGVRKLLALRPASEFKTRLLAACDPDDAGILSVRNRLETLASEFVPKQRAREALDALDALHHALNLAPGAACAWAGIMKRAGEVKALLSP
ncbi:MAG: hypothetical protein ABSE73_21580 [Planctomycetota bacterium]